MAMQTEGADLNDTSDYLGFEDLVERFYEDEPRAVARVTFGASTDRGSVRSNNEDNFIITRRQRTREVVMTSVREAMVHVEQAAYVLAVADGLGGHDFGELASSLALRKGWDLGGGEVKWTVKLNEREAGELAEKGRVLFNMLDGALHEKAFDDPKLSGMGTTLTLCYSTGPEVFVMHAGDSRAYLLRGGRLEQLTHDHTRAQELIDAGLAEPGSPRERRNRHVLTNCIGGPYLSVEVDVKRVHLRDDDVLMLCTDGLYEVLSHEELTRILVAHAEPQAAADALIKRTLERGAPDNVTAVVARYFFEAVDAPASADLPPVPDQSRN